MDVQTQPSVVTAEQGLVIIDGPDGVAVTLTPDAAIETADRLNDVAVYAKGQEVGNRMLAEWPPNQSSPER